MYRNILFLRTIFKEFDEQYLEIYYGNDIDHTIITFKEGKLSSYIKFMTDKFVTTKINYYKDTGLNVEIKSIDNMNVIQNLAYMSRIEKITKQIYEIDNIKPLELSKNDKKLITVYKYFYNENPDFMAEDINLKFQTMAVILSDFNIKLRKNCEFYPYGANKNLVEDLDLETEIEKLFPFGKIQSLELSDLSENEIRKIKIIGENVRNYINQTANPNESLITLSKVIYENQSIDKDLINISKCSGYPIELVEKNAKLVRSIKTKLSEN